MPFTHPDVTQRQIKEQKTAHMEQQKKQMLEALERSLGIVTTACNAAGIGRTTHYRWMKDDPEYKQAVKDIDNRTLDFAESHLHKLIKEGNPAATIFFLKTKGKARGYVERQEIEMAEKKPLSWFTGDDSTVS
jgi:anaerobic C4-dicarboxylate transporter